MNNKFSQLQLNKKTIAKLNERQLSTVKGGNKVIAPVRDGDCTTTSVTNNCTTTSTTGATTNL
ncbi:rSAM-modified peptide [Chryseobacterium sp. G0162]|uniref:class I lanthipeptide n=1 Tax=unclassified Chryseobacterium TaxID=2593645 RepID=UPI000F4EEA17|nr:MULTISPECIES: class I lanthipeptide [unclassified Chryseobacterium]AZB10660.1 rSAM-modified peptide [Chryseobacterium sp. G0162]